MGGNGSYSKEWGGVPEVSRTHIDTNYRVDGHKVLLLEQNPGHDKIIMNSNSENPVYLFASVDKQSGVIQISGIGIYEKHVLKESIDLKFDKDGNVLPFSKTENGSHAHLWYEKSPGIYGRKSHDKSNYYPISKKYQGLINKIEDFNRKGKKWK